MLEYEYIIKLSVALLLGLLIGIDRQIKHKPLGLKTSIIICVASCLITIVSIQAVYIFPKNEYMVLDPLRLAAQIVSGIGFIGAGVILRRSNDVILGLTTAAVIWAAAGIGIAVGAGFYEEAIYSVVLFIFAINILPFLVKLVGPHQLREKDVAVRLEVNKRDQLTHLFSIIEGKKESTLIGNEKIRIRHVKMKDLEHDRLRVMLTISVPEKKYITQIYEAFKSIENVNSVEIEQL